MTDHAAVLATFDDVKAIKTRKVVQIICEAPIERYDEILSALGGYPHNPPWVAIARVDEKLAVVTAAPPAEQIEQLEQQTTKREAPSTAGWSDAKRKMVQRAGIVCKEAGFQAFLSRHYPDIWRAYSDMGGNQDVAAGVVRRLCLVKKRRELEPGMESGQNFVALMQAYRDSQRGWSE